MKQPLCMIDDIGERGKEVDVSGDAVPRRIMLFRRGNSVHAWINACPHQGRSLNLAPDRFYLTPEGHLMCPHHGACFDLESGQCLQGPCEGARLTPFAVEVRGHEIWGLTNA